MNSQQLLNEILGIIRLVKDEKANLEKILDFLQQEILSEEEEDEIEIPEKFKDIVKSIVESIDAGLVCFLNPDTLEIEDCPKVFLEDPYEMEESTGTSLDEWDLKHDEWENCIEFTPLESNESFEIMEDFARQLADIPLQNKLMNALSNRKPFANFKYIIDNSQHRQAWFDFKDKQLQKQVRIQLSLLEFGK